MTITLHNKRGTASVGEYVLIFSMAVLAVTAMSTYVQRTLQGRMHDTREYMMSNLRDECEATNCVGRGAVAEQYEPYYAQQNSTARTEDISHKGMIATGKGTTGQFVARMTRDNQSDTTSSQLPPVNALGDQGLGAR